MANLNLSEFTEKLFVADADHTFIWDSAVSISKRVSRNSWLNSGTLTSDAPVTISQTWNDLPTAFTAFKVNATSTNSAAASKLLDLQLGGVTQFSVRKDGRTKVGNVIDIGASLLSWENPYLRTYNPFSCNGIDVSTTGVTLIVSDAANTLALRNGAAAQTFRVYNTFPGTGNNEYGEITWDASTLYFRPAATGTATIRASVFGSASSTTNLDGFSINLRTGGSSRFIINSGGFFATNDNQLDIGSSGGNRPRNIYVGSNIYASGNVGIGTTSPTSKLHVVGDAVLTGQLLGSDYTVGTVATATQNNVAITNNHTGQTDSAFVITPKGAGSFIAGPKPDGTATGGNARGNYSVDLQRVRSLATQVASGANSFIGGGDNNSSLQGGAVICGGTTNTVNASLGTIVGGTANSCVGFAGFIGSGEQNSLTRSYTSISGGFQALADRYGIRAQAAGRFAATGDAQATKAVLRNKTTTNSAVELFLNGSSDRYTITSGKIISMLINITGTKSDGSAVAHYVRQYSIKNIGGTTSQVYAAVTVGTDNAAGTSIAISADDANDSLKIEVTGVASETWRWVASVDAVEVGHGT